MRCRDLSGPGEIQYGIQRDNMNGPGNGPLSVTGLDQPIGYIGHSVCYSPILEQPIEPPFGSQRPPRESPIELPTEGPYERPSELAILE